MVKIALIGLGGAMGAISRYLVYEAAIAWTKNAWLPLGTIFVNISGCFIIGLLGGLAETKNLFSPEMRALIFIGFLGGFTTFSTFGFETVNLIRSGQAGMALANTALQLGAGIIGVWVGLSLSRLV